jgi:hypothetical protein
MMVKSAQPGEDGGCTSFPLSLISTITSKVETANKLLLFLLYPYMYEYSVVYTPTRTYIHTYILHKTLTFSVM